MGVSAQGVAILICAQLSCASTSSWVHSLPAETPSLLKGLWRQTFTSLIFLPISLYASHNRKSKPDKLKAIEETSALEKIVYIVMAVVGFGLQNIGMVIGLGMASTASVMCLTNTTPMWLILWSIIMCHPPSGGMVLGAALALVGAIVCASGGSDAGGRSAPMRRSAASARRSEASAAHYTWQRAGRSVRSGFIRLRSR